MTNAELIATARNAYRTYAAARPGCSARSAFNAARAAVLPLVNTPKQADAIADLAMQEETDGRITLNDIRWSEFEGGVGA